MPTRPELRLVLVGFGHVSRRLLGLLDATRDRLPFTWRLAGVCARTRGGLLDPGGLDHEAVLASVERARAWPGSGPGDGEAFLADALPELHDACANGRVVVVETTVLDATRGEPALTHVRLALDARAHVVTANKGPAAFAYHELAAQAARANRAFLFESAVMDGVPVFSLVADTLPALAVTAFRGVVNTTCGYILAAMERGVPFAEALAEMQAKGIAEADPSLDIDGWDAAAKTAALVNVLMAGGITPHDVTRMGIRDVSARDLATAVSRGRRVRLVASAARRGDALDVRVEPEMLDPNDPLACLGKFENALFLRTDLLGEVGIVQRTSSLQQTAYALLSDLTHISRRLREL
jgi:homoserine dehydrogenase